MIEQTNKINFFGLTLSELQDLFLKNKILKYKATTLYKWIYKKLIIDLSKMSDLGKNLIEPINNILDFNTLTINETHIDPNDETTKFLLKTSDNQFVESVIMKFNYGYSACISSQIGCNMGCKFCASGLLKKIRNLKAEEIVQQIWLIEKYLLENKNSKLSNIVVMGIGEPFDNYENLKKALTIINDPMGLEINGKRITVSTSGLANMIQTFGNDFPTTNLAISLHAPNDEIRNKIMPINSRFNISELFEEIKKYLKNKKRRITFEYILLKDVNDSNECAEQLAKLVKNIDCLVNIIFYNSIKEHTFSRSTNMNNFVKILKNNKILVTTRLERGKNIDAACGQLRANKTNGK